MGSHARAGARRQMQTPRSRSPRRERCRVRRSAPAASSTTALRPRGRALVRRRCTRTSIINLIAGRAGGGSHRDGPNGRTTGLMRSKRSPPPPEAQRCWQHCVHERTQRHRRGAAALLKTEEKPGLPATVCTVYTETYMLYVYTLYNMCLCTCTTTHVEPRLASPFGPRKTLKIRCVRPLWGPGERTESFAPGVDGRGNLWGSRPRNFWTDRSNGVPATGEKLRTGPIFGASSGSYAGRRV